MDGRSARVRDVVLHVRHAVLCVEDARDGTVLAEWSIAGLSIDAMQEGGVAHIVHVDHDPALVTTESAALLGELRARGGRHVGLPGGARPLRYIAIAGTALIVAVAGLYASVPFASRAVAVRVPLSVERKLAPRVLDLLSDRVCGDADAQRALDGLVLRLAGADEARAIDARIVRAELVNAFALPGGVVVLTTALVRAAGGPDEVAGVLAHEIEHVRRRHVMTQLMRSTLLSAVWSAAVGDFAGMLVIDPTTLYEIANLRFSRDDESEADRGALAMLARARIDPRGLLAFFERIDAMDAGGPTWLSSHPATAARIDVVRAGVGGVPGASPSLTDAEWGALRGGCGAGAEIDEALEEHLRALP
jgi:Zn-dependent protease with chaperone function